MKRMKMGKENRWSIYDKIYFGDVIEI